jgi:phage major head subunit gpT-like protein
MRQTKEIIGANVFNRAFNSSYKGGDGVEMISTAHPNVTGGTWSNELATASDLSEAALEQAAIDIYAFTDDRGLLIAAKPQKLVIASANQFEAMRILEADGRTGTDSNDPNVLKTKGVIPSVIVNHYLTDADAWFILTDIKDGLKYFERRGDAFEQDNDFDTENAKFKATGRYVFGWTDPRGVYGSEGA